MAAPENSNRSKKGSRVHVGVRIRPLTSQEIQQGGKSSLNAEECPTIRMGQRQFTYDAVFDSNCGQGDLYDRVSAPLLTSFMDGYNATVCASFSNQGNFTSSMAIFLPFLSLLLQIMSYGQTGSGKTYTMGSEAHTEPETSSQAGLIPRFITDFFLHLQRKKEAS